MQPGAPLLTPIGGKNKGFTGVTLSACSSGARSGCGQGNVCVGNSVVRRRHLENTSVYLKSVYPVAALWRSNLPPLFIRCVAVRALDVPSGVLDRCG